MRRTNIIKLLLLTWPFLLPETAISAPPQPSVVRGAEYTAPVFPFTYDGDLRYLPRAPSWQPGEPIKEIPKRRKTPPGPQPATPPPRLDALLAVQGTATKAPTDAAFPSPILNFGGQGFSGVNPPDTVGEVGASYYIQMINGASGTLFTIYNKTDGSVAAGPITLDTLGSGNCTSGLGDPIVLYDEAAGRWLLSEFSASANRLCVYISQTSNPVSGGWYNYEFTTPYFPDYPKYSVWPDAYYVTSNELHPAVYALQRSQMLTGSPASLQRFTATDLAGFGFQALTPADLDGNTAPPAGSVAYFMRHRDDESHNVGANDPIRDYLELWTFHVDWATPANSTFTGPTNIAVTEFDSDLCGLTSFNCIPQPGSGVTLDPLREVIMWRLQYRNFGSHEALVGSFVTDVTGTDRAGVRWFELRKAGAGAWSLYQEGTYAPDSVNRWMSTVAMDDNGNLALAYNVSDSTSVYPGLRYTGRLASDTTGTLPQGENSIVSGSAANGSNRYGDYMAINVDPVDDCTFWVTGEYNPASTWSTRIGNFAFSGCRFTPYPACSGADPLIQATNFSTDTDCVGDNTLTANNSVSITGGAHVNLVAPIIKLGPIFRVETGSTLRLVAQ